MVSCQKKVQIIDFSYGAERHLVGVQDGGQLDTLIVLPYPAKILDEKITKDSIGLVVETPKFYEYILIIKKENDWQIDTSNSGGILSTSSHGYSGGLSKDAGEFTIANHEDVYYKVKDEQPLRIPIRLIRKKSSSWIEKEVNYNQDSPPFMIELIGLKSDIEIDSLNINRTNRIKTFLSILETSRCIQDSTTAIVQVNIDRSGHLIDFRTVKVMELSGGTQEEIEKCLEEKVDKSKIDFGQLKTKNIARRSPTEIQYSLIVKKRK